MTMVGIRVTVEYGELRVGILAENKLHSLSSPIIVDGAVKVTLTVRSKKQEGRATKFLNWLSFLLDTRILAVNEAPVRITRAERRATVVKKVRF